MFCQMVQAALEFANGFAGAACSFRKENQRVTFAHRFRELFDHAKAFSMQMFLVRVLITCRARGCPAFHKHSSKYALREKGAESGLPVVFRRDGTRSCARLRWQR